MNMGNSVGNYFKVTGNQIWLVGGLVGWLVGQLVGGLVGWWVKKSINSVGK